jgi:tetratricopeptide (TPR) repeat protein
MNEYTRASENFQNASNNFEKAAENTPQLNKFYKNYSKYMKSWSYIEKARNYHLEKKYGEAKIQYEKAAKLLEITQDWNYMSQTYIAWARVEEAEDLSRKEKTEEARDLFQKAARSFDKAQASIRNNIMKIKTEEDKTLYEELLFASEEKREYCLGRSVIEEARIMDRQGDHLNSSKKYKESVEIFQSVFNNLTREPDKNELVPIINLCKAWEKMMLAETQASSNLYNEAAELFLEARKSAIDQTTSFLAQAHSSFCKAMEAGTKYELTREIKDFSEAKRHIEASMTYYLRAGNQTMSEYAGATSRFLDAYLYTYNAQMEIDPIKKAQFYQMAERLLQSSAGAYLKAKHPEKSEEIRRILARVKEEKEIAVNLSEVLHAPSSISTTTSFVIPSQSHEQAIGLERFENADIQSNIITQKTELGVGDEFYLEIEMVNAGKAPAQLIKVEDIVVEGFELKSYPDICRLDVNQLDMKGRTLLPLKTQELKLILQPKVKGVYEFKPRILYLDEAGKYKSHETEPVTISVQELGIKGWLKGPV